MSPPEGNSQDDFKPPTGQITVTDRLATAVTENAITLAKITVELEAIGKTVASLAKVVRDGNGSSLITRLSLIEARMKSSEDKLDTLAKEISKLDGRLDASGSEMVKGKYNVMTAIISGVLGIVVTLLAVYLKGAIP